MTDHDSTKLITPPIDLIRNWNDEAATSNMADQRYIAIQAANWGANQELEACREWLSSRLPGNYIKDLLAARRPKSLSLKAQAQLNLDRLIALIPAEGALAMAEPIRLALEQLND